MPSSPYEILGLSPDASEQAIKNAHRRLARKHHPDKNQAEDSHEKFLLIQEAFEFLKDKANRRAFAADPGSWDHALSELKQRRTQLKRRKNRLRSLFE